MRGRGLLNRRFLVGVALATFALAGFLVVFDAAAMGQELEFAIAGMIVAMTGVNLAVAGAIVVLYRICVYWFPVLIGLLAAVYTGTSVRSLDATIDR